MSAVAVVGAGDGGLAVAGWLALHGARVALHDIDEAALAPVAERGAIEVRGVVEGEAPIALATSDLADAVDGASLVVVVVPGTEVGAAARALAPHVGADQIVLVMPGGTGGALEAAAAIGASAVAEADAFPFICSRPEPGVARIDGVKRAFSIGVAGDADAAAVVAEVRRWFPDVRAAPSVLHTSLSNMNALLHVAPTVLNAARIDAGERFEFYTEGITPAVVEALAAYDAERLAVAAALDVEVASLTTWAEQTYAVAAGSFADTIGRLQRDVYGGVLAPTTLQHRFLLEDVPCGTVPVASIGRALGVDTPLHWDLVGLASLLTGRDLVAEGRTAERLGVAA